MCASALHAATAPPFLAMHQVTQRYPLPGTRFWQATQYHCIIDNVTPSLNKGEHVGLVGASGAGKSTLLKILLELATPNSGSVHCQGRAVVPASTAALRWYRQLVQYIPQDPAATLALRPAFLIADEPVSGLDLPLREQITALFDQLARHYDMGMLVVSHDISTVAALCQRVLVLHQGHIVEDRPCSALLSPPARGRCWRLSRHSLIVIVNFFPERTLLCR